MFITVSSFIAFRSISCIQFIIVKKVKNMSKRKETARDFCARVVSEYPDVFRTDNSILFCKFCEVALTGNKISNVKQHIETAKHKKAVETKKNSASLQQTLMPDHQRPKQFNKFNMDLCQSFLEANIPLKKVSHPSVIKFIENYTGKSMPSESTLRKTYVPILYDECMDKMQAKAENKYIWASIDETTDSENRMVTNFIFGILDDSENSPERGKCYLLNMEIVDAADASNMAAFFNRSLSLLWPNGRSIEYCIVFVREYNFFRFKKVFNTIKCCLC